MNIHGGNTKVGRNEPCPCGSGKKFKRCHGGISEPRVSEAAAPTPEELEAKIEQIKASQKQRQQQQGLGKSIISVEFRGYRFVAVGSELFYSSRWKTFHDFLLSYIKSVLGPDWGNSELKKPHEERHPILSWYHDAAVYMGGFVKGPGKVNDAPASGVISAFLGLAYDLYSLEHNAKVQAILLKRLKNRDQFYGAFYETSVAAALIRAGFTIDFEDETDATRSHCEFTATFTRTGKKYSVEAKRRQPGKPSVDIGNQLYEALKKEAQHTRLIFIEVNVPDDVDHQRTFEVLGGALKSVRTRQTKLTVNGAPAPPAYVIVTNTPYQDSQVKPCRRCALAEGFKIPDFKFGDKYYDVRSALQVREKHQEITRLMKSMGTHSFPPSTFDGDIPDLAFSEDKSHGRLIIGHSYLLPDGCGGEAVGQLQHAVVVEQDKTAVGIYKMPDGKQQLFSCPLTEAEIAAYRKFPDTFFGVDKPHSRGGIDDPLELYDWLFSCYSKTPKERLLELMKNYPDRQHLERLPQGELASVYCERLVYALLRQTGVPKNRESEMAARVLEEARKPLVSKAAGKSKVTIVPESDSGGTAL